MNTTVQPFFLVTALTVTAALSGCATTLGPQAPEPKPVAASVPDPDVAPATPVVATKPVPAAAPALPPTPLSTERSATAPLPAQNAFYVIRAGDTGLKIAHTHGLTLAGLSALNPGVQWNRLKVGQRIRLRAS